MVRDKQQSPPGSQSEMRNQPRTIRANYIGTSKLQNKTAIITGADSGIGRSVAVHFAREGCNIVLNYLDEDEDAQITSDMVQKEGMRCLLIKGDIGSKTFSNEMINSTILNFGRIDIIVNNAGRQMPQNSLEDISKEQLEGTFRTNIFSMFYLTQAALKHLRPGSAIINTTSVTAFKGNPDLIDYSSTKGAILAFTRSLALSLAEKGIRVNCVAPGPIWTPLIVSTFDKDKVKNFGKDTPMKRPGQPEEVAPAYVFLASEDSSYMTGQTIHVNGGSIVNS